MYCARVTCRSGERLLSSGACDPCPQFEAPVAPNFYTCARPTCITNNILLESGICKACPELHTVVND